MVVIKDVEDAPKQEKGSRNCAYPSNYLMKVENPCVVKGEERSKSFEPRVSEVHPVKCHFMFLLVIYNFLLLYNEIAAFETASS